MTKIPTAAFIVIGDEILNGRTADRNINVLARFLAERGIDLAEVRIIGDDAAQIIATTKAMAAAHDCVFTSGGIGPTHDDITAQAMADAFGRKLILDAEADCRLRAHYAGSAIDYNEARQKMAYIPADAGLIDNPVSTAPGFIIENVFVMAGVPSIFAAMLTSLAGASPPVLPGGVAMHRLSVQCHIGEGNLAAGVAAIEAAHQGIRIGCYPWFKPVKKSGDGRGLAFGTAVVVSGRDKAAVAKAAEAVLALARELNAEAAIEDSVSGNNTA